MVGDLVLPCLFFLRGKVVRSTQRVCYGEKFLNSKANRRESYKVKSTHNSNSIGSYVLKPHSILSATNCKNWTSIVLHLFTIYECKLVYVHFHLCH